VLTDLPNLLTLARIGAIPLLVLCAAQHTAWGDGCAGIIFALAAITDWLDGYLARRQRMLSEFGRMLDPIADKLLVTASLVLLAGSGRLSTPGLYAALLILLREILVSGLREYLAGREIGLPVTRLAKWKTAAQMVALFLLLLGNDGARWISGLRLPAEFVGEGLLWAAALLTLITGWGYLLAGLRIARQPAPRV
jgi:cardiolipin synthase